MPLPVVEFVWRASIRYAATKIDLYTYTHVYMNSDRCIHHMQDGVPLIRNGGVRPPLVWSPTWGQEIAFFALFLDTCASFFRVHTNVKYNRRDQGALALVRVPLDRVSNASRHPHLLFLFSSPSHFPRRLTVFRPLFGTTRVQPNRERHHFVVFQSLCSAVYTRRTAMTLSTSTPSMSVSFPRVLSVISSFHASVSGSGNTYFL